MLSAGAHVTDAGSNLARTKEKSTEDVALSVINAISYGHLSVLAGAL